ncbi:MAG: hypothetical protein F4X97_14120 [Boseongicola sp. SB0662_bin_57]|nr:hypothetical protein [Boseongicola sp. SB0662_bin_57]
MVDCVVPATGPAEIALARTFGMKIGSLNAGHQVPVNAGELPSVSTMAEKTAHPRLSAPFRKFRHEGIAPCVAPAPGMTPCAWIALIKTRFLKPAIQDTKRRAAFDGQARHAGFVEAFEGRLGVIRSEGAATALDKCLRGG